MKEQEIVKIGNVELKTYEAKEIYISQKYIVTYSKIYQVMYSQVQGLLYGHIVYVKPQNTGIGYTRKGRFAIMDANQVNKMLGFNLIRTEKKGV